MRSGKVMINKSVPPQSLGTWESTHKILIPSIVHEADGFQIEKHLQEIDGIITVKIYPKRKAIKVRYNQLLIDFRGLLEKLEEIGFPSSNSWWNRTRAAWFQSLDSNAKTNANLPPPQCCSSPKGLTKNKKP